MNARPHLVIAALFVSLAGPVCDAAAATLFRIFLTDGSSLVAYGEAARVDDRVVFAMPVGGSADDPRLHTVTLAASLVDWARTSRYTASARYQQFAERAESDYQRLTDEVAALLNDIALSTDRERALALAAQARRTLIDWPRARYGYRQDDIRDIASLIDGAIVRLGGTTETAGFELAFVATTGPVALEPLAAMPGAREQLDQLVRVLNLTVEPSERLALMQSALALIADVRSGLDASAVSSTRRWLETEVRREMTTDRRYAEMTRKLVGQATRAAADARIDDVEEALRRVAREDERLGHRRPQVVQALTTTLQAQLDRARHMRLLLDQWNVRKSLYRNYQRTVSSEILQLVKAQQALEAIRQLEGPDPERLDALRSRLSGGATRLDRLAIPSYLRPTHDLLVAAWRFAETAVNARTEAVLSGHLPRAWEASAAAAGSMMMLSRAQKELRERLEPPRLP